MKLRKHKDYPFTAEKLQTRTIFSMKAIFNSDLLKIQTAFQYSGYVKWTMYLFFKKNPLKFGNWWTRATIRFGLNLPGKVAFENGAF